VFMEVSSINKIDNPKMEKHIIERPNSFLFFLRVFINFLIKTLTNNYEKRSTNFICENFIFLIKIIAILLYLF